MNRNRTTALLRVIAAATTLFIAIEVRAQGLAGSQPCPCRHASYLLAQLPDSALTLDTASFQQKSENAALNYSLFGTLIPTATLVLAYPGLLIGPSMGYFYTGQGGRAWTGIGVRALATGGMISAFGICGWDCGEGDDAYNVAWAVFIASGGVFVGSAIYDIATVKRAVRERNQSLSPSFGLAPTYSPARRELGLRLSLRF